MQLSRIFHKPFRVWALSVGALFLLGFVRVGLMVFRFRVVRSSIDCLKTISAARPGADPDERSIQAIRAASRFVPGAMCLAQSLALEIVLALGGIESRTCFGVAKAPDGHFKAHAWVESRGKRVSDASVGEEFVPLTTSGARTS